MFWIDKIIKNLGENEIINDSKTPSGRVHVGALRGVVIHYYIHKVLQDSGKNSRFLYGVDDYDPLDELPYGLQKDYHSYLGYPLSNVPAVHNKEYKNLSELYILEFFDVFKKLDIHPEIYRMSEFYLSGKMNEPIERILNHKDLIQELYYTVSGSKKEKDWYPFQVICEKCNKIGTTFVSSFDGKEVSYQCLKDLVSWAKGCGYKGKVSPYDGKGKLPWKLEWVAKWKVLGVSFEGAGKDHSSKGGSRDISEAIFKAIYPDQDVPKNLPYEFFVFGKRKMSSSKGIGASAYEIAEVLPPNLLRFLMIRYLPHAVIDFNPYSDAIPRLFDEYDKAFRIYHHLKNQKNQDDLITDHSFLQRVFELSEFDKDFLENSHFIPRFLNFAMKLQIKNLDLEKSLEKDKGDSLNSVELKQINFRKPYIEKWIDFFAPEDFKIEIKKEIDLDFKKEITEKQKVFLIEFKNHLQKEFKDDLESLWTAEKIHNAIYDVIKLTEFDKKEAFETLYRVFFSKTKGPKLGRIFFALGFKFIENRIQQYLN